MSGAYHWRDGWYFQRLEDGGVLISKRPRKGALDGTTEIYAIVPPNEWASIIAAVSAYGDLAESYAAAERLHAGDYDQAKHEKEAK